MATYAEGNHTKNLSGQQRRVTSEPPRNGLENLRNAVRSFLADVVISYVQSRGDN